MTLAFKCMKGNIAYSDFHTMFSIPGFIKILLKYIY